MDAPLISVIIPFYKGEKFIAETLESIFSQNYKNLEIIIVDDGSPARSSKVLESFSDKVMIVSEKINKGQATARNIGLRRASGSIIALLDQDDLWSKDHLALMLPYLVAGSGCDFVQGLTQKFHKNFSFANYIGEPLFQRALVGSALYKKHVFDIVGLFDEEMREGDDFDWNIRLKESSCKEKRISNTTLFYRKHEANYSDTKDFIKNGQLRSLKNKLEREKFRRNI